MNMLFQSIPKLCKIVRTFIYLIRMYPAGWMQAGACFEDFGGISLLQKQRACAINPATLGLRNVCWPAVGIPTLTTGSRNKMVGRGPDKEPIALWPMDRMSVPAQRTDSPINRS